MNINYVKAVNDVYNSKLNIEGFKHKFTTIANAIEQFTKHSVATGVHPIKLKIKMSDFEERYQYGRENFGLYYASIFTMYLNEI